MKTARGPDPLANPAQNTQVTYDQVAEYRETAGNKVVESVRLLLVDWNQRINLIKAMLATARVGPTVDVNGNPIAPIETPILTPYGYAPQLKFNRLPLNRLAPELHPEPLLNYMVAVEGAVIEGLGWPSFVPGVSPNAIAFFQGQPSANNPPQGKARVAVTYRSLPYKTQDSDASTNQVAASEITRYVWRQPQTSSKVLPIQGTFFREYIVGFAYPPINRPNGQVIQYTNLGQVIPEPVPRTYPQIHCTYHWEMVPCTVASAPPVPACYFQMNQLNEFPFDSLFPFSGSLLTGQAQYLSSEYGDPYYTWHGDLVCDIRHHVIARQPGFNWRHRPFLGRFVLCLAVGPNGQTVGNIAQIIANGATPEPLTQGAALFDYGDLTNLFKIGNGVQLNTPLPIGV